ncbi:MAG: PEGA domain-containing protein [Candidatus Dojkabacteria bacterium]|jgi:hypothetical protein|nr:PEGA domain-containing protein [Candidatus Dojkabacteria bacterium]MDD2270230.1 PEGA domain-containing protein [Candidatus Dojkabacteria bacterium]
MIKKKSKNLISILTSIFVTLAVYTGALAIFLYVQGWRFDFIDRSIKQVGVLTIESSPTGANIYVNDIAKGRTNKSMTLDVGTYDVLISKDGYYDWKKSIKILEEKSTPIFPYLVKTKFESKNIFDSTLILEKYWADKSNNRLSLLLKGENSYEIVHYNINSGFWTLNSAPITILTIPIDLEIPISNIDLQLSPSGEMAILEIVTQQSSNKYVIPTTIVSNYTSLIESPLSLTEFQNYELTWAENEKYLILESEKDVISYNISKNTKQLLLRKIDDLDIWSTDKEGYFYIFRHLDNIDEDILKYTLKQYNLDGSSEIEIIPTVFFQNNLKYLENYRKTDFVFGYFSNSPESTQTMGQITEFAVNQESGGVFIKTTQASYWYDSTIGKYITASPYPADLLEFSGDGDKLLLKTATEYAIFTFDKEEGDHTVTIGTQDIANINIDLIKKINWLSNSSYLQFEENDFIYISDIDGDNKTPLLSNQDILYWTVTSSRNNLVILTNSQEEGLKITSYTIH